MNTFARFSRKANLTVLVLFLVFSFLFMGCDEGDKTTYKVDLYYGASLFQSINVKNGYKVPTTNETVAAHVAEQGLYWAQVEKNIDADVPANAKVLEEYVNYIEGYFWTVFNPESPNHGTLWDFNDPVTGDMVLMATPGESPYKYIIAGRRKVFYDNVMSNINNITSRGVYVMLLKEDAGESDNEALQLFGREVNNTVFTPGVHLAIIGIGRERTIHTKGSGVFILSGDANFGAISLTLGKNITVRGKLADNGLGMIRVGDGKRTNYHGGTREITFTMLEGSKVIGFTGRNNIGAGGAAVAVQGEPVILANDPAQNNHRINVLFHMKGGIITGNENIWSGGGIGSGVTLSNARMIMEGNAKITGNSGFGGDLAFGTSAGRENTYLELKDSATIGEVYLFNNEKLPGANNYIKINTGWTGRINKLNLGWGGAAGGNFIFNDWFSTPILRNAEAAGGTVGSISAFIQNITMGDTFQWSNGNLTPNGLSGHGINSTTGNLE